MAACAWLALAPAGLLHASELPVSYPESERPSDVIAWLGRETDITPKHVVSVSSAALLAVMQVRQVASGPIYQMTIRGEITNPHLYERERFLSWYMPVEVDCANRQVRHGRTTAFRDRNLLEETRVVSPASDQWMKPPEGGGLDQALRAACDSDFRWPLTGTSDLIAQGSFAEASNAPLAGKRVAPKPETRAAPDRVAQPVQRSDPPKAPVDPPPRALAATAGDYEVQVIASASEASARRALDQAAGLAASGVRPQRRIERAAVRGKVYFRGLLGGYSALEAKAVCDRLRDKGAACLVRAAPVNVATAQVDAQPKPSKK